MPLTDSRAWTYLIGPNAVMMRKGSANRRCCTSALLRETAVGSDGYNTTFYIMLIVGIVGVIGFVLVAASVW